MSRRLDAKAMSHPIKYFDLYCPICARIMIKERGHTGWEPAELTILNSPVELLSDPDHEYETLGLMSGTFDARVFNFPSIDTAPAIERKPGFICKDSKVAIDGSHKATGTPTYVSAYGSDRGKQYPGFRWQYTIPVHAACLRVHELHNRHSQKWPGMPIVRQAAGGSDASSLRTLWRVLRARAADWAESPGVNSTKELLINMPEFLTSVRAATLQHPRRKMSLWSYQLPEISKKEQPYGRLLLANLRVCPVKESAAPEISHFRKRFGSLPQELTLLIYRDLYWPSGSVSRACNRLLPQWIWRDLFFQVPFLFDLGQQCEVMNVDVDPAPPGQLKGDIMEWDWERLYREISQRVQMIRNRSCGISEPRVYENFSPRLPSWFKSRRRIWQMLDDMYVGDTWDQRTQRQGLCFSAS